MKNRRNLDRIPSEELTAYERWELPLLDQEGNEVGREEERDVKPLTAADIEEIRQAAWNDGHAEGREAGYQAGHEEGRKQGHQEGFESGRQEGRDSGRSEAMEATRGDVEAAIGRLETVMAELLEPIARHQEETEAALVNLTTVLARAVIFRELSIDSSHIQAIVRQAIAGLPSTRENVRIRVHPEDADYLRQAAGRFEVEAAVVEDDAILKGGCKVETRHSLVDFTVEKRFQKAIQGMLDRQLASDDAGDHGELDAMMGDLSDFHGDLLATPSETDAPGREEPAQADSAQNKSNQNEPNERDSGRDEPDQREPDQDEPVQNEPGAGQGADTSEPGDDHDQSPG
ncbi:MAG: flagellar assembly protein FliH [Marinobacter sp.]|uniref:flagellar assembly protein FliH n=1 Tax=Marinobacter sp. TaxID=50741 RepID=UPI00299E312C|nr:flagellar assembly protein FliH [Marinobacter sp.]MDX1633468.1 flagellar assembly protein FliH [Marinobacter sp.]